LSIEKRRISIFRRRVEYQAIHILNHIRQIRSSSNRLTAQTRLQARHQQRCGDPLSRHVANRYSKQVVRQQQKVVIITTDTESRSASAAIVETDDRREFLRKQPLLNFSRDLNFAIEALALRDFGSDRRGQVTVLESQSGLTGY